MPDNFQGNLKIDVTVEGGLIPIENANITIYDTGNPDRIVEQTTTNSSGQTEFIPLSAPNPEYSLQITEEQPYSEYNLRVEAEGYEPFLVSAMQILPGIKSLQQIPLRPLAISRQPERSVIPPHTLFYDYPPKIPEPETKNIEDDAVNVRNITMSMVKKWISVRNQQSLSSGHDALSSQMLLQRI